MSANSDRLKAYEAQKAKALEQLSAAKNNFPIKIEVVEEDFTADIKPKIEPFDEISNVNTGCSFLD